MSSIEDKRYPLATQSGEAVPYEVLKPKAFMKTAFGAVATAALAVPADGPLMMLVASEDCYIQFNGVASVPADGVLVDNLLFVPRDILISVSPPAATFTVIGDGVDGTLCVQYTYAWAGLSMNIQSTRK